MDIVEEVIQEEVDEKMEELKVFFIFANPTSLCMRLLWDCAHCRVTVTSRTHTQTRTLRERERERESIHFHHAPSFSPGHLRGSILSPGGRPSGTPQHCP